MPQVGPLEILVIFVIALVVFGPKEIPKLARQAARTWRQLQRFQATVRRDIDDVLRDADTEDDVEDDAPREHRGNRPPRLAPKAAELEAGAPAEPDTSPDTSPDVVADEHTPGAPGPADPTP